MAADVALNKDVRSMYPFSRLKDNANVLVMLLHPLLFRQNVG